MATLKLINLTKRFAKSILAVNSMDLEVQDGEYLVLLGPSGCGKTTTMRMIAGLEEVTAGKVILDGVDITHLPPRKRDVSMVFQNYAVWPHMTVYGNIAFALKLKGIDKQAIDEIVKDVAGLTKIDQLLERYPSQLSGGQQQRVAVARAIAVSPKIFLMDEPLSNLDAKLRVATRTELKAIHNKTEATTIFVTHDQAEAMSMADRIVIMKDGEIMQIGTPEDVYDQSANLFVADFIGTPPTNFLEVEFQQKNGHAYLVSPHLHGRDPAMSSGMRLNVEHARLLAEHGKQNIILGVRPENILLVSQDQAVMSTECLVSEPQGSHQIVAVELGDKIIKIIAPVHPKVTAGQTIHLTFKKQAMRFFDPDTGLRIH